MAIKDKGGWRKSSYSSSNPTGDCVEIEWRKSSYSGGSGSSDCVEVAFVSSEVAVRDSKNTGGPTLTFPATAWRTFVAD